MQKEAHSGRIRTKRGLAGAGGRAAACVSVLPVLPQAAQTMWQRSCRQTRPCFFAPSLLITEVRSTLLALRLADV